MNVLVAGVEAPQADIEAIIRRVAELEYAQQHEQVEDFMRLFRPDAVWVTAVGRQLIGWEEINAFTHHVLPGAMTEWTATYEVVHILFVRPDVAVVNVRQRPVTLDGRPYDGWPKGSPVYVMAKDEGEWKIAAGQNTLLSTPNP